MEFLSGWKTIIGAALAAVFAGIAALEAGGQVPAGSEEAARALPPAVQALIAAGATFFTVTGLGGKLQKIIDK